MKTLETNSDNPALDNLKLVASAEHEGGRRVIRMQPSRYRMEASTLLVGLEFVDDLDEITSL